MTGIEREMYNLAKKYSTELPQHKKKIEEMFWLAMDEIEDGSSVDHEIELFQQAIEDLREEG
jgi:hypothetical protein